MRLPSAVIFALCLGAGVRLTATASPQTFAVIREGVVHYAFVDGVPATIVCTPGLTCDLALERGEEIQDIVCARSTHNLPQIGWTIDLGSQGNRPYLYLTPTPASPPANLIITTNRRRYVANLIAQPTKHLSYAFDTATSARASDLAPKVAPSSSPLPSPSATPRTVDEKFFTVRPGGPLVPFIPSAVRREGDLTVIELPAGYYAKPSVLAWDPETNQGRPIGWSFETDASRLIVQGIFPHLLVYTGDLSDERKSDRVYIDRADLPVATPRRRR